MQKPNINPVANLSLHQKLTAIHNNKVNQINNNNNNNNNNNSYQFRNQLQTKVKLNQAIQNSI